MNRNKDYFCINGTRNDAILALCKLGVSDDEDSEKLLRYLEQNPQILNESETVRENCSPKGFMGLTLSEDTYYVNVKITTILIVALLLDIFVTKGFLQFAIGISGIPCTTIHKIEEANGEKCILKEILTSKNRTGEKDLLKHNEGKCLNSLSTCKFRNEESCKCNSQDVNVILQSLASKNILKKVGSESYRYQF